MSDWIKLETGLRRHPKVVRMSEQLLCETLTIVGALHAIWSIADEHSHNGKLRGYTPDFIDAHIRLKGFSQALSEVGWLVVTPDGVEIPRFKNHNGASAKRRAMEQKRKRDKRRADREEEGRPRYGRRADNLRTRERERSNTTSGGKPPSVRARTRRCPDDFRVSTEHTQLAATLRVDLEAELAVFRDHEFATPRSDWAATLRNWLRKAAAQPRATSAPPPRRPSTGAALSTPRPGASPHDPRPEPPPVDVVDVHATRIG